MSRLSTAALCALCTLVGGFGPLPCAPGRPVRAGRAGAAAMAAGPADDAAPATAAAPSKLAVLRGTAAAAGVCAASFLAAVPAQRLDGAGAGAGTVVSRLVGARPALAEGAVARATSAAQQKRLTLLLKKKLAKVPVFMVTNEGGSPFLNQLSTGDQSALMFLFPGEAQKMLNGVLKAPNGGSSGAKVLASNLDRAFRLARLDPTPSGLRDQTTSRELTMVWQFMPHAPEMRAAQALLIKKGKAPSVPSVPGYFIEGLVYTKRGQEVTPLFLSKQDADAALAKLAASGADDGAPPAVTVVDALGLLLQMATDIDAGEESVEADLISFELVPPSESLDFREKLKADKVPLKARIVPPDHSYRG